MHLLEQRRLSKFSLNIAIAPMSRYHRRSRLIVNIIVVVVISVIRSTRADNLFILCEIEELSGVSAISFLTFKCGLFSFGDISDSWNSGALIDV